MNLIKVGLIFTLIVFAVMGCSVVGKSKNSHLVNADKVVSIYLLKNNNDEVELNDEDSKAILAHINSAVYDKEKNNVKFLRVVRIASPNYRLVIKLKGGKETNIALWSESPMLNFNSRYYNLTSEIDIKPILDKYESY